MNFICGCLALEQTGQTNVLFSGSNEITRLSEIVQLKLLVSLLQNVLDNLQRNIFTYANLYLEWIDISRILALFQMPSARQRRTDDVRRWRSSVVACTRKVSVVGRTSAASLVGWRVQSVRSAPAADRPLLYSVVNLWGMMLFGNRYVTSLCNHSAYVCICGNKHIQNTEVWKFYFWLLYTIFTCVN